MERYFTVTEKSELHKEWFECKENINVIGGLVKEFKGTHGIEADGYYVNSESLYVVPTDKDVENFGSVLCSPIEDSLRKFRTTSKIGKAWVKSLKDANLKVLHKPMLIFYFNSYGGRFRSRIFDQDGILYCSIDPAQGETPEGFEEMKASEFYKIIEDSGRVAV